jgi:hypothetical protein
LGRWEGAWKALAPACACGGPPGGAAAPAPRPFGTEGDGNEGRSMHAGPGPHCTHRIDGRPPRGAGTSQNWCAPQRFCVRPPEGSAHTGRGLAILRGGSDRWGARIPGGARAPAARGGWRMIARPLFWVLACPKSDRLGRAVGELAGRTGHSESVAGPDPRQTGGYNRIWDRSRPRKSARAIIRRPPLAGGARAPPQRSEPRIKISSPFPVCAPPTEGTHTKTFLCALIDLCPPH